MLGSALDECASLQAAQRRRVPLQNNRRVDVVIGVPEPSRRRAKIRQVRPLLTFATVGKDLEIELRQARTLGALGLISPPLVLNRAFVGSLEAADHEGDVWSVTEVLTFPRTAEGVKDDLKVVGNRDAHYRTLCTAARVQRALHRVATASHEAQQRRASDGHGHLGGAA